MYRDLFVKIPFTIFFYIKNYDFIFLRKTISCVQTHKINRFVFGQFFMVFIFMEKSDSGV